MLDMSVLDGTNIVTADFSGSLDVEDEKALRAALDEAVAEHGGVRVLASIGEIDFGRIEPRAAWMDVKAAGYLEDIDRLAVVSDASWVTRLSEWTGNLTSLTVRTFPSDRRDEAIAWLSQP